MNGASGKGEAADALTALRESAAKGDARAQARLGRMHLHGQGVERDYRQALDWLRKGAEQGDGEAQADLGYLLERGLGIGADPQQALACYKLAVAQNNALGQVRLGDLYLNGTGVDQSYRKAFACYRQAVEQAGDPESGALARIRIGAMHCQGRGVEKDLRRGFEFYLQAAELGNAEAQCRVGAMYRDGAGVERDHKKALLWLQKSARKDGTPADRAMGDLYRDGLVVEKNIAEALAWYKKAADKGDSYAKGEWLKLQKQENAPERAAGGPAPAPAGDGDGERAGAGTGENAKSAGERKPRTEEGGKTAPHVTRQPAPPPVAAQSRGGKPAREKAGREKAPRPSGQARKMPAPFIGFYLLAAIAVVGLALVLAIHGFRKNEQRAAAGPLPEAVRIAAPLWPRYRPLPPALPGPPPEVFQEIKIRKAPRLPGAGASPPEAAAAPAAPAGEPAAPRLRREYKSLDEAELADMLAARNLFDAARNPGGNFPHRYEALSVAGVRLIADGATRLVWTRQQNPVKMNLERSRQWIDSLNRVEFGGIRSWRLPTVEEAASLLQGREGAGKPFLDDIFGAGITEVWTGDGLAGSASWIVDFQDGSVRSAKSKSRLMTLMVSSDPASAAGPAGVAGNGAGERK